MHILLVLSLGLAAVAAVPARESRIVGGSVTNIRTYPYAAVILYSRGTSTFSHSCGGTILNNRSILSAAHCFQNSAPNRFRIRVGSTYSNSGGSIYNTQWYINHPGYNPRTLDNDCTVLRISGNFRFNNYIQAGRIAGANYNIGDNQVVWAIGWGALYYRGPLSPNLRHVQIWTVNQAECRRRYAAHRVITDNMLCSGWLDVGGRDQCQGDSGSPLLHNGVVVGISSFGNECARPFYPGVNVRVPRLTGWISSQA